jgi:hypothetical protein
LTSSSCHCKGVTFETTGEPSFNAVCHCSICRKTSGADFYHSLGWSSKSVNITGKENLQEYKSSEAASRQFCKTCGSTLFITIPAYDMTITTPALYDDDLKDFKDITYHCYYGNRVIDVTDGKTKYNTDSKGDLLDDAGKVVTK